MTATPPALRQRRPVLFLVGFLYLLVLGLAPQANAAGSGAFTPTGPMSAPHWRAAAAPLPDGRVLVTGGLQNPGPHSFPSANSAEVFNPATGTFTQAGIGSMSVPRVGAVAAPLPDGRVLVAGGFFCERTDAINVQCHDLSSAEVFNPDTGTFRSAGIGSMSVPRTGAVAAPLPDGRVLVAGGSSFDVNSQNLSSAEIFDPSTNSFSSAGIGSMAVPRAEAVAAPLADGRVLVAGGYGGPSSAEVFNSATNTFSSAGIGSMSVPRFRAAAAPLPDGRALVVGGLTDRAILPTLPSAEVFDPATNTFSSAGIGSMSVPRHGAAAAPLPGGRVLVAGGYGGGSGSDSSAEVFAPVSCRGKQPTIVGTGGADQITGTRGADVIIGAGGDDKFHGLAGRDVICGGEGNDKLYGRKGSDKLYGNAGDDTVKGGPGKDILKGGPGIDTLTGGVGKDILKGGPGKDALKGGPGKDKQVQ